MSKTVFSDTPPIGTLVTAAFLNALNNHRHTGLDEDGEGAIDYAVSTGSANAYVLALNPALAAHIPGMPVRFKANHTNTGAATIAINGMAAVPLRKNYNQALSAGDITSGRIYTAYYDGTNYQLPEVSSVGVGAAHQKLFTNAAANALEWASGLKLLPITRDVTASSGDVSYTGVGFPPGMIILPMFSSSGLASSIGISDVTNNYCLDFYSPAGFNDKVVDIRFGGAGQTAIAKTMDADGFTLTWTKIGSPGAATISGVAACIR